MSVNLLITIDDELVVVVAVVVVVVDRQLMDLMHGLVVIHDEFVVVVMFVGREAKVVGHYNEVNHV
jgi:hypothetical protein